MARVQESAFKVERWNGAYPYLGPWTECQFLPLHALPDIQRVLEFLIPKRLSILGCWHRLAFKGYGEEEKGGDA